MMHFLLSYVKTLSELELERIVIPTIFIVPYIFFEELAKTVESVDPEFINYDETNMT